MIMKSSRSKTQRVGDDDQFFLLGSNFHIDKNNNATYVVNS